MAPWLVDDGAVMSHPFHKESSSLTIECVESMDTAAKMTGRTLGKAVKQVRRQVRSLSGRHDLSPTQMRVLREVTQANGLTLDQLSRRTGLSPAAVHQVIGQLQSRELVNGEPGAASGLARIMLSEALNLYLMRSPTSRLIAPLLRAYQGATPDEQAVVLHKLDSLRPLIDATAGQAPRPRPPGSATRPEDI